MLNQQEKEKVEKSIDKFITEISFLWKTEPLDGDETEEISLFILERLDEENGNM